MKLESTIWASLPLCLLLTGCPLTDHYRVQDDSLAAAGTHAAGNAGEAAGRGDALGGDGSTVGDAGESASVGGNFGAGGHGGETETAGNATGGSDCSTTCDVKPGCFADSCTGSWVKMASPPPLVAPRSKAAAVAMGSAVFIWGGLDNEGKALDNGAIYEPAKDLWTPLLRDTGSPSGRIMATAVWTGAASNKVIVYGGTDAAGGMVYRDGAIYDVFNNSWAALPPNMMGNKRSAAFGYWDGSRAVFFGGLNGVASVAGADRFDLKNWSPSTMNGDPGLLGFSAIGFDGSVMYLQGGVIGSTRQDKVFAYTSSTDRWATLPTGPSARTGAFGAWAGTEFVVWGGQADAGLLNDGKALSGSTWSEMTASSVLSARRVGFGRSGWAFQVQPGVIAILGGQTSTTGSNETLATDGATYAVQSGQWSAIPPWPSAETHEYGIGVWTGKEFVLWGGRQQNVSTPNGERWAP